MKKKIFGAPIEGEHYIVRHCAYGVILNEEKKVALALCDGEYFLPGGGIEGDETPEACIKRECIEELALAVEICEYICYGELFLQSKKTGKYYHNIGKYYTATITQFLDQPSEEDHVLIWMDVEEAIEKLQLPSQSWAVSEAVRME